MTRFDFDNNLTPVEQTERMLLSKFDDSVKIFIKENFEEINKPLFGGVMLMSFIGNLKQGWLSASDDVLRELRVDRVTYDGMLERITQKVMDVYMKFR